MGERLRWHAGSLSLYAAMSWLMFGHPLSLTHDIFGSGTDPLQFIWFLEYWPWAFTHHVASLHTHLVWQPVGLNLAWTTCVPLLALLAWPVTAMAGPVAAFNLLTLAAPALTAWGTYFLCLDLFALPGAAVLGGLLVGFSSYEAAQTTGHLNLDFAGLVPLILLVALRRVRGRMRRRHAVPLLGMLLGGQFLVSAELLATGCVFGLAAWGLAWPLCPAHRAGAKRLAADMALAAPVALAVASPILLGMALGAHDAAHPSGWAWVYSTDLLNFIVPTAASLAGLLVPVPVRFTAGAGEVGGYLGLPLIWLLCVIARAGRNDRTIRLLTVMLGLSLLATLGPALVVGGRAAGLALPWALALHVPLLGQALPARLMLFAWVAVALLVCLWIAEAPMPRRYLIARLVCISVLPMARMGQPAPDSAFFRPGEAQRVLGENPRILVLPFAILGPSSYWQAESGFGFTQVGGYLGMPPKWAMADPVVAGYYRGPFSPSPAQFARYCRDYGAEHVVAGPGTDPATRAMLRSLDWQARKIDDVMVFTVPSP